MDGDCWTIFSPLNLFANVYPQAYIIQWDY